MPDKTTAAIAEIEATWTATVLDLLRTVRNMIEDQPREVVRDQVDDLITKIKQVELPTVIEEVSDLAAMARTVARYAEEPDGLARIRAILAATWDHAQEEADERWREKIREAALARAGTSAERAKIAHQHLPHNPQQAAAEARWAADLDQQAIVLRSLL